MKNALEIIRDIFKRNKTVILEFNKNRDVKVRYKNTEYTIAADMVIAYKIVGKVEVRGFNIFKPAIEDINKLEDILNGLIVHDSCEDDLKDAVRTVQTLRSGFISIEDLVGRSRDV